MGDFDPSAAARPDSGLFGLDASPDGARVHVLGVPFDATTSFRKGAAGAPAAILAASHQVDLYDLVTGRPYEAGIWMAPLAEEVFAWNETATALAQPVIEAGGEHGDPDLQEAVRRVDAIQAELDAWVEERTRRSLAAGKLCALVGGDHSVPFGAIRAHAEHFGSLGLLHVDAHADLRVAYEGFPRSHASILDNVLREVPGVERVLSVGLRDLSEEEHARIDDERVRAVLDHDWASVRLAGGDLRAHARRAIEALPRGVYVTFDVDGLDPALCPNTGTPVPGGLRWDEAMLWLEELVRSGRRIVGCDLCEVAPDPAREPGSGWDETVGARLLYRLIGFALQSARDVNSQ